MIQILIVFIILAGLFYFWQRARVVGLHWIYIVLAYILWPIGTLVGLYWAITDFYFYYRGKPLNHSKPEDKDSNSLKD